jgi:hypothetical protein
MRVPCGVPAKLARVILGCMGLLGLGPFACGAGPAPPQAEDPCKDVDLQVERFWSAQVKAQVLGYGGGAEASQRQSIANKMDSISEDWVRLRRSTCRDHFVRKTLSTEDYQSQVRCFDDRLDQQRKLVTLLKDGATAEGASLAQQLVGDSNACK